VKPAVSVMMVCYNAAPTLPWAFGSLLAQTSNDWECIFVDDGSSDCSFDVAVGLGDPRIRVFRFDTNRGRGAARQFALEQAEGDYLCMLDADDWMYPWRLQTELGFLEAEPKAALVSGGMAILDSAGALAAVRGSVDGDKPQVFPPITRLQMPPFGFPQSMIRMSVAKLCKFDPGLPTVEDVDFLMQIILNHGYGILDRSIYAYTEYSTVKLQKLLEASHFCRQVFQRHRARFPLQSRIGNLIVFVKSMVHRGAFALNRSEWLVRRRSRPPTLKEVEEFQRARRTVALKVEEIFGTPVPVGRKSQPTAEPPVVQSSIRRTDVQ
jgi:glycosyltransferase involved in cell wall biosynthesis